MNIISGTSKEKFIASTKAALEFFIGSKINSDSKVRQFIKVQHGLPNEHVIDKLFPDNGDVTRTSIDRQLYDKTESHIRQRQIILDFIEKNGLMTAMSEHIQSQEKDIPSADLNQRFLHDIDCLISGLHEHARNKAIKVVRNRDIVLEDHYSTAQKVDFIPARCFVSALGNDMEFQYRPADETSAMKKLIKRLKSAI